MLIQNAYHPLLVSFNSAYTFIKLSSGTLRECAVHFLPGSIMAQHWEMMMIWTGGGAGEGGWRKRDKLEKYENNRIVKLGV